jgi:carboxypeptidase T
MKHALPIVLACFALGFPQQGAAFAPSSDVDSIIVSGTVPNETTVRFLQDNFDVWQARSLLDGYGALDIWVDPKQAQLLQSYGFNFTKNVRLTATLAPFNAAHAGQRNAAATAAIAGFPCYRTVEETYSTLNQLTQKYPNLARTVDVGDSYLKSVGQGGYPIKAIIIENTAIPPPSGSSKPTLFLMSAIHAREYATAEIATRFAERLLSGYGIDPDLTYLLDSRRVIVVPQMNPDGRKRAETGVLQRRNLHPATCASTLANSGVDLNRNSSFLWGTNNGSSISGCADNYRGETAASEPEVQAFEQFLASTFPDRRGPLDTDAAPSNTEGVFISLHSYADLVLFPWGANATAAPNKAGLQTLARKFGFYTQYQVCQPPALGCLYAASGTSDDQSYGALGTASFTFEVGNVGFFESCSVFEASTVSKNIEALIYALKATRRPYLEPAGPEVTELSAFTNVVENDFEITIRAKASDIRSASGGQGNEAADAILRASMFINSAPNTVGATEFQMDAADGNFNTPVEAVVGRLPVSLLRAGRNAVYVTATDISNQTGVVAVTYVRLAGTFSTGFE